MNAMPGNPIRVHLGTGTPIPGKWCDACLLPSVVEIPFSALTEGGVYPVGCARECASCDARLGDVA